MNQYSGVDDPDRHSPVPLALSKIEARVRVVTTLSSANLPPPLSKDVASTLVRPFFLVRCSISFHLTFPLMCVLYGIGPLAACLLPLPEVVVVE